MGEKARGFDKKWIQTYMLIFIVIGLGVILSFISSNFLTVTNLLNVVRQIAVNGILAIGMTIVCLTGGIDLSVGSIVAFSGIIAAGLLRDTSYPIIVVVLAAIAVGAVCGLYNGYFVAYWNAAPFVVTLSMMTIARGMTYVYSDGRPISNLRTEFLTIGKGSIAGIPIPTLILAVVFILGSIMLTKLKFGRYVYAVGGNPMAARVAGVNNDKMIISVYMLAGFLCAAAGIIVTGRMNSVAVSIAQGLDTRCITCCVLGGASVTRGGKGTIIGCFLGVFIIGLLQNSLDLLAVSSYWQTFIQGVVLFLAVSAGFFRTFFAERRTKVR